MKCPNCGYFNLPGVTVCGQCQRTLGEASIPVTPEAVPIAEIYPPRASKRGTAAQIEARSPTVRQTRRFALRDWQRTQEDALTARTKAWNWWIMFQWWLPPLLSLVPGLGHFFQRRFLTGASFLCATILFVLLGIAFLYAWPSNIFFLGALGTTWWAIRDAAEYSFPPAVESIRRWRSLRLALLSTTFVSFALISALALVNTRYALWNMAGDQAAPFLQQGDALVVERFTADAPLTELRRGDVVVYNGAIERVLGMPGDYVSFQSKVLSVNGKALSDDELPITFRANSSSFEIKVAPGNILLWIAPLGNWQDDQYVAIPPPYVLVREDQIHGRVAGIYNPPYRRRRLDNRNTQ